MKLKFHLPGEHDQHDHAPGGGGSRKDEGQWAESAAVDNYTSNGYSYINQTLREGNYDKLGESTKQQIAVLDRLTTTGVMQEDAVLYRVIDGKRAGDAYLKEGATVADKAFVSTSTSQSRAERAVQDTGASMKTTTTLVINAPKGSHGHQVGSGVKGIINPRASESEVLLPRGSRFRVTRVDRATRTAYVDLIHGDAMSKKVKFATADVIGYPIFRVGKWNNMEFSLDDIKQIAATYNELKDLHHVPLKLGHNDEQPLTDGQPALGWIRNVKVRGDELIADFHDVPKILKELIAKRRFRSVSIELVRGAEYGGKKIPYLLDAVAILGADQPAVRALPDLSAFLASRSSGDGGGRRVTFEGQAKRQLFTSTTHQRGSITMDEDEIKQRIRDAVAAAIAPLQTEANGLRTELTEWKRKFSEEETKRINAETEAKDLKAKFTQIDTDAKKQKVTLARTGVTEMLETAVKAKKITPAKRDIIMKTLGVDDDARVVNIVLDDVKSMFSLGEADKTIVNGGDKDEARGGGGDDPPDGERKFKDVFQEVNHRIAIARSQNAALDTYHKAMRHVFAADKELHREYLKANTPERSAAGGN